MAGTGEDPWTMLEAGIRASTDKVKSFDKLIDTGVQVGSDPNTGDPISLEDAFLANWDTDVDNYVNNVQRMFDAVGADKLDIIMKEYHIALWGNGLEAYNNLRRTSKPNNIAPAIDPAPGTFIWSAFYPADYVNLNANAVQKSITDKVFWDNTAQDAVR